jgi:hypothetical protein
MASATPFAIVRKVVSLVVLAVLVLTLVLILKKSPAPNVVTSPAAAASAEQKLDAAAQAASTGQTSQVQLNSTELNSFLEKNLQLAGGSSAGSTSTIGSSADARPGDPATSAPQIAGADPQTIEQAETSVEDVKIDLDVDLVKTYVVFNFHGKDLSLEIDGHLHSQDGYLKFEPVDGKIGSFPLPKSALQAAVQRMMDSPENREKLRLPPDISNIEVENSQVLISYK